MHGTAAALAAGLGLERTLQITQHGIGRCVM
jgi:hypothetical protein